MRRPSLHDRRPAAARRGFTLIELVIALSLTSIVAMALMSALLLSLRAIPGDADGGMVASRLDAASEFLLADVSLASTIVVENGGERLRLTIPDTTGDAAAEDIRYRSNTGVLRRRINGGDWRILADDIASASFSLTTSDGRIGAVNLLIKTNAGSVHRAAFECLARPEE